MSVKSDEVLSNNPSPLIDKLNINDNNDNNKNNYNNHCNNNYNNNNKKNYNCYNNNNNSYLYRITFSVQEKQCCYQ